MKELNKLVTDGYWTLFLDRDGVLNKRIPDDYVKIPDEFIFIPGVKEALGIINKVFMRIVIVTNQQGIGRGKMTTMQLNRVHENMVDEIRLSGGRIDSVYHSPDLKNTRSFTRKPAVGMGLKAKKDYPEIRFKKSIMVGDTYSDMLFGCRLDMVNVLINDNPLEIKACLELPDFVFPDLISFAKELVRD